MSDLIELKQITREDAKCLHNLQVEAFMPLYEKYHDDATSPAKESLERVTEKIVEDNSDFYFILFIGEKDGGVRVKWFKGKKVYENVNWISPIFIIPKFQNNCHLYEKCCFVRTGNETVVNENMTRVYMVTRSC